MRAESKLEFRSIRLLHWILWTILAYFVVSDMLVKAYDFGAHYGIVIRERGSYIVDFASIFNIIKSFWLNRNSSHGMHSLYSVAYQLQATRNWAGNGSFNHALPFAYSPTMLLIFYPFVHLTHAASFYLFNVFGLISVWWQTHPVRCRRGIGLLAFISPLAVWCFRLGQTALVTGAGVLIVFEKTRGHLRNATIRSAIFPGIVLWALTAKPPLALAVGAILAGLRCWRPLLIAAALTLCMTLATSPFLGPNWVDDYTRLISTYNRVQADPVYAWSLFPRHMANLRGVLSVDFGVPDNIASMVASGLWIAAIGIFAAVGPRSRLRYGEYWSIGILLYLLLCPHVSSTEELLTALLIPFCISPDKTRLNWQELLVLFSVPLLVFVSPAVGPFFYNYRLVLFVGKILLILFFVFKRDPARQVAHA